MSANSTTDFVFDYHATSRAAGRRTYRPRRAPRRLRYSTQRVGRYVYGPGGHHERANNRWGF